MKIAHDKDTWMIPSRHLLFPTMVWMSWFSISGTALIWAADITVQNNVGVKVAAREAAGKYALGSVSLDGQIVETPLETGVLAFRNAETGQLVWLPASRAEQVSASKVLFSGSGMVDGATIQFKLTVEAPADLKAVKFTYDFSSDWDLPGWQAVLAYHSDFTHRWKCHIYPYAEDSRYVQRDPLSYMGIPSLLLYRDDRSLGVFWGLDMNWDYLDPTNWTKDIGLYFIDGVVAPQFRVGGASLKANFQYEAPMQLVMTANPDPDGMITELMQNWIRLNRYWPEPLQVRSNDQALNYFIEGRKKTSLWNPGKGYRLEYGDVHSSFIYIGEQGLNAYFDYLIYELTGDPLWRIRAFEQMDFIAKGQNTNPDDPNYGVVQTAYNLNQESPGGLGFNSLDRGTNPGYKPDLNAHLPRYMLLTWKRVKDHEGTDRQDWYKTAKLAMDWVMRQQNVDGGLAQKIELQRYDTLPDHDWMDTGYPDRVKTKVGEKSPSAASGRALPATWWIYKLTSDPRYRRFMDSLEQYTLDHVQNQYYYTGHHPDLPPIDFEEASIWGIAEYWLNRYEETHDRKYVDHAVADAYLALTWWCPKQLSWVKNPTLGGSAEQQHFLQYSVYSYQDRKPETIQRLYQATGDPLWGALAQRVFQNIYFTEITEGDFMGATHERIADPWLARKDDPGPAEFNSMGTIYMAEQSLDAFLQVVEIYRTGRDLYFGGGITNRVYPDGVTYYAEDILDRKKANLSVLPSSGTITVKVDTWTGEQKKWTVNDLSGQEITTLHKVGDLKPLTRYRVLENSRPLGTFLSDAKGTIQFSQTAGYKASRSYEVESR